MFSFTSAHGSPKNAPLFTGQIRPASDVFMGLDGDSNPNYFVRGTDGKTYSVQPATLNKMMENAFERARSFACGQRVAPESVSVSVGVLSASWGTNTLCETSGTKK